MLWEAVAERPRQPEPGLPVGQAHATQRAPMTCDSRHEGCMSCGFRLGTGTGVFQSTNTSSLSLRPKRRKKQHEHGGSTSSPTSLQAHTYRSIRREVCSRPMYFCQSNVYEDTNSLANKSSSNCRWLAVKTVWFGCCVQHDFFSLCSWHTKQQNGVVCLFAVLQGTSRNNTEGRPRHFLFLGFARRVFCPANCASRPIVRRPQHSARGVRGIAALVI